MTPEALNVIVKEVIACNRSTLGTVAGEDFLQIYSGASQTGTTMCNSFDMSIGAYPTAESFVTADISYPTYGFGNTVQTAQTLYLNNAVGCSAPLTVDVLVYGIVLE